MLYQCIIYVDDVTDLHRSQPGQYAERAQSSRQRQLSDSQFGPEERWKITYRKHIFEKHKNVDN